MPSDEPLRLFAAADLKCLETRRRPDGLRRRRYKTEGVTVATVEVPVTVLRKLGPTYLAAAIAAWQRGHDRRVKKAKAIAMLQAGEKQAVVEHELGYTESAVYKIAAKLRREKK